MRRTGPLRDRLALKALRLGVVAWGLAERVGLDIAGASEGPPVVVDEARRSAFDELIADAAGSGAVIADCPYPKHELLTYLVRERGLLLHGSKDTTLDVLEPRPARDFRTELMAVAATDDGIWPMFYAVVAREHVGFVFSACVHAGRRRLYLFAIAGDPAAAESWSDGVVYVLPRAGFRREWGREWVSAEAVRPLLRVPVSPEDFPLRGATIAFPEDQRQLLAAFRAAKRAA